jgi:type IV secretory pathway TraG/TraD family ATPase VirD4
VLDPFDISGQPSAAFNPLAGLDPDSLDLAEDAALLADALVGGTTRVVRRCPESVNAKRTLIPPSPLF